MILTQLAIGYTVLAMSGFVPKLMTKDEDKQDLLKTIFASISFVIFVTIFVNNWLA